MSAHEPGRDNHQQVASQIDALESENTKYRKLISRNELEIIRLQEAIDL